MNASRVRVAPPPCLPAGVSNVPPLTWQPGLLGEGKSLSERKSFPCPHSKGSVSSEDGARIGSVCPAAPRRAPEPQDPSSPSFPYPQRCLSPLPSSPQAGAFNYSCPPLQTACARWAGAIVFQTGASWEAPAAFPACRLPEQGRESHSVSSLHSRGGEAWLLPCMVCKR